MPREWLRQGVTHELIAEGLQPLLALPVELVLPAHGPPTDCAALERALPDYSTAFRNARTRCSSSVAAFSS